MAHSPIESPLSDEVLDDIRDKHGILPHEPGVADALREACAAGATAARAELLARMTSVSACDAASRAQIALTNGGHLTLETSAAIVRAAFAVATSGEATAAHPAERALQSLAGRIRTIADEACGLQPVMSAEDALTLIERRLFELRVGGEKVERELVATREVLAEGDGLLRDERSNADSLRAKLAASEAESKRFLGMLSDVACALGNWPANSRNAYVPEQLADKARAMCESAVSTRETLTRTDELLRQERETTKALRARFPALDSACAILAAERDEARADLAKLQAVADAQANELGNLRAHGSGLARGFDECRGNLTKLQAAVKDVLDEDLDREATLDHLGMVSRQIRRWQGAALDAPKPAESVDQCDKHGPMCAGECGYTRSPDPAEHESRKGLTEDEWKVIVVERGAEPRPTVARDHVCADGRRSSRFVGATHCPGCGAPYADEPAKTSELSGYTKEEVLEAAKVPPIKVPEIKFDCWVRVGTGETVWAGCVGKVRERAIDGDWDVDVIGNPSHELGYRRKPVIECRFREEDLEAWAPRVSERVRTLRGANVRCGIVEGVEDPSLGTRRPFFVRIDGNGSAWFALDELEPAPAPAEVTPTPGAISEERCAPTSGRLLHAAPVLPETACATGAHNLDCPAHWGGSRCVSEGKCESAPAPVRAVLDAMNEARREKGEPPACARCGGKGKHGPWGDSDRDANELTTCLDCGGSGKGAPVLPSAMGRRQTVDTAFVNARFEQRRKPAPEPEPEPPAVPRSEMPDTDAASPRIKALEDAVEALAESLSAVTEQIGDRLREIADPCAAVAERLRARADAVVGDEYEVLRAVLRGLEGAK